MNDLISRQAAIEIFSERAESLRGMQGDLGGACRGAMRIIESLPSAESKEQITEVIEHDASVTDTDGYKYHRSEYICGACKKKVIGGDCYCSHCGARLEWE